jgi:hypothetical protein
MPYAEVRVHPEILDALAARIRLLVEGKGESAGSQSSRVEHTDPLMSSCQGLFNEILPLRQQEIRFIRDPLCDLKTALLIATNVPEVPWELLHNGTDFLGLRYEMGRSLRARGPEWRPGRRVGNWQCLIIADPTEDLPTAAVEAAAVKESLEAKGIACDYLAGKDACFANVLNYLNSGHYDIIHYSGHIGREEESHEFGFILNNGQFFTASSIRTHVRTPAIAFLNGCNSGAVVQGLTEAFLSTGAQMVVGSLFNTPSRGAAAFAKKFYADFLRGVPAGEAMRQARLHVKEMENCGLSWACFVMYGDPRFSITVQSDELDTWLEKAGFERSEFDAGAIKIVQQAVSYGAAIHGVSSAVFFAALVEGEDPFLRQQLDLHGALQPLEGAFKAALKDREKGADENAGAESPGSNEANGQIEVSAHVLSMLRRAKEVCLERGLPKISEPGLVCAFAREADGGAWEILRGLKITPADLDPWKTARAQTTICGVGTLTPSMCSAQAWAILIDAAQRGIREGAGGISAVHLLQAMAAERDGLLAASLRRLGISFNSSGPSYSTSAFASDRASEQVQCSRNVSDILARAQSAAAADARLVEERDLLRAFVENGGGGGGALLLTHGVPPRMLTSRLFLDGGIIDSGRFDEAGQKVFDETLDFARQRGYPTVGSRHLLYGLLSASDYFAQELRHQDRDADLLAEAFYASLPSGNQGCTWNIPHWSSLSTSFLKVLLEAEALSESEGSDTISDKHLLRAWCLEGSGAARAFLIQQGVRVRNLFK